MSARHSVLAKPAKPWGNWVGCSFLVACGLGCHGIVMIVNYVQGLSAGLLLAFSALLIDFVGVAVLSGYAGYQKRKGDHWGGRRTMGYVMFCSLLSLAMFYGFNAATKIEPTRQAVAIHSAEVTAQTKSEIDSKKNRERVLGFLESEAAKAGEASRKKGVSAAERDAALKQQSVFIQRMSDSTSVEYKPPPVENTPDAMAVEIARALGWETTTVQGLLALAICAMLLFLASKMIHAGTSNLARGATRVVFAERRAELLEHEEEDEVVEVEPPRRPALRTVVPAEQQVIEWVKEGTRPSRNAVETSTKCYRNFCDWARHNGYHIVPQRVFGLAMTKLNKTGDINFPRNFDGKHNNYHGRAIDYSKPWVDADELAAA